MAFSVAPHPDSGWKSADRNESIIFEDGINADRH
jgi:hypothetical protein